MVLEKLPTELLHSIGEFLPTKDTGALRLASRNVSSKVSQGPFASVLRSKTRFVEFSPHALQLLVEMTRPGAPGTALESLILVGVPWSRRNWKAATTTTRSANTDTPLPMEKAKVQEESDDQTDADLALVTALLAEALRNLRAHGAHRGLPSLSLTVDGSAVESLRREWVDIWAAASQMFHATLDAMRHSPDDENLNIGALDLFTRPYCCSLSVANFSLLGRPGPDLDDDDDDDDDLLLLRQCAPTISRIRKLHLSISRERNPALEKSIAGYGYGLKKRTNLPSPGAPHLESSSSWAARCEAGFARFLAAFRSVEDLKIHQYRTYYPGNNIPEQQQQSQSQAQSSSSSENQNHGLTQTQTQTHQTQQQQQQQQRSPPPENHHPSTQQTPAPPPREGRGTALGNLTRCSLAGLMVSGSDLLAFVQASPGLQAVELRDMAVRASSTRSAAGVDRVGLRQVFDWLTVRAGSALRELRLEQLQEKRRAVVFRHEPDDVDEVDNADGWGRYRLTRAGEASARRPVLFGLGLDDDDEPVDLEAFRRLMDRRRLLYGQPSDRVVEGTKTAKDYY